MNSPSADDASASDGKSALELNLLDTEGAGVSGQNERHIRPIDLWLLVANGLCLEEASSYFMNKLLKLAVVFDRTLASTLDVPDQTRGLLESLEAVQAAIHAQEVHVFEMGLNVAGMVEGEVVDVASWEGAAVALEDGIPEAIDVVVFRSWVPELGGEKILARLSMAFLENGVPISSRRSGFGMFE